MSFLLNLSLVFSVASVSDIMVIKKLKLVDQKVTDMCCNVGS